MNSATDQQHSRCQQCRPDLKQHCSGDHCYQPSCAAVKDVAWEVKRRCPSRVCQSGGKGICCQPDLKAATGG